MPAVRPFIDTNILIYAFSPDTSPKVPIAEHLLAAGGGVSTQVLNEFVSVSHRKLSLEWAEIAREIEVIKAAMTTILPLTVDTHDAARSLAERHKIAFYDALIIASALEAKCSLLLTEDLQHGAQIEGIKIRNPFA